MKKIITLLLLLTTTLIYSQSPGITYQAVLYNPGGEILPGNNNTNAVLSNKNICLRFSIKDAQASLEYQETQAVKTDEFGMVNLSIGSGVQIGGYANNFSSIVWNSSTKKLQVEIDATGTCVNFIEVSNQNFSAVPFAYASKNAEKVTGIVPIANGGTGSTTVSGAKTNLGLNNIDNTSDINKPISSATQTALNGKENTINKSTDTALGTSDVLFPTQNAVKTYVDNQVSSGVIDATTTSKGKIQLGGDLAGTASSSTNPIISNAAITTLKIANNAITNAKIGEVVSVNKGGSGADMSTAGGYLKQATIGANFSTITSIPVADVAGAVHSVNGVHPAANGNVSVIIGQVTTGTNSDPTQAVVAPHNSDIYVVSGQTGTPNDNGRTFINDGNNWHEIATNIASLENTFVKLSGSTMFGNLVFPTGKKITIADAPTGSTDVANKNYVDTKIGGSGTVNFISKFNSASLLENSNLFDNGTNVGIGTIAPTSKLEVNGAATNATALNSVASTAIDFSKSNLAYTTASAGAFILTNIKDGGTFTLAVQGASSGISIFTCTGFTFKYVNNGITSPNKHTLYTFLVMGTTVYVYMATGF
ncbi:MAG: hypothetical protein RLZZ529_54 [Bacteroidota bacterium]|jgi:hypothetical protein